MPQTQTKAHGGSVLFSFQPPSPFFSIDGARGTVTVTRALDYETTSAYQLTVNATDQDKKRPLSSLSNLAITITDVQDMDPIFTNLPYSTNIEEDAPLVSNTPPLIPPLSLLLHLLPHLFSLPALRHQHRGLLHAGQ
ncbi:unnamed protein product [Oncorhynchus mykiss]|uniref:Cadherin domain-containing protein n=1 Tax=Oncorhynchus mykiss TaxID=8022 RepID=A0A060ZDL5_ONCMY|nr:unnamed protein product [Oncorhynchus mykiss]